MAYTPTNDQDLEALEALCERFQGFDELANLEWLDGYMAALAAGPRRLALEEWLPVFGDGLFERVCADPADAAQAQALIAKRWAEVCHQLDAEAILDAPDQLRLDPLMYRFDEPEADEGTADAANDGRPEAAGSAEPASPVAAVADADPAALAAAATAEEAAPATEATAPAAEAADAQGSSDDEEGDDDDTPVDWPGDGTYWAVGFMDAVADFSGDWVVPSPDDEDADTFNDLLECVALLADADLEHRLASVARLFDGVEMSRDELITEAMYAVQELRMYWLNHAPKPVTRRVEKVGRNDPCTCGSGKKYKKCCGANA